MLSIIFCRSTLAGLWDEVALQCHSEPGHTPFTFATISTRVPPTNALHTARLKSQKLKYSSPLLAQMDLRTPWMYFAMQLLFDRTLVGQMFSLGHTPHAPQNALRMVMSSQLAFFRSMASLLVPM